MVGPFGAVIRVVLGREAESTASEGRVVGGRVARGEPSTSVAGVRAVRCRVAPGEGSTSAAGARAVRCRVAPGEGSTSTAGVRAVNGRVAFWGWRPARASRRPARPSRRPARPCRRPDLGSEQMVLPAPPCQSPGWGVDVELTHAVLLLDVANYLLTIYRRTIAHQVLFRTGQARSKRPPRTRSITARIRRGHDSRSAGVTTARSAGSRVVTGRGARRDHPVLPHTPCLRWSSRQATSSQTAAASTTPPRARLKPLIPEVSSR